MYIEYVYIYKHIFKLTNKNITFILIYTVGEKYQSYLIKIYYFYLDSIVLHKNNIFLIVLVKKKYLLYDIS